MHQVEDEPLETLHIYIEREHPKQPSLLPLFFSVVALSLLVAIGILTPYTQPEQRASIRVPAVLLPPRTFTAVTQIRATGIHTYPATYAHGLLTFSNGSVIGLSIPQGFTVDGAATDMAVYVPPATANGFGMATVSAHLLTSGINKSTLAINVVVGASLFIRNLSPFTGGHPAYSVHFVTGQDMVTAIRKARDILALQVTAPHYPCKEDRRVGSDKIVIIWRCQFATYTVPSYMHVTAARLFSNSFLVDVVFVVRPKRVWVK